MKPAPASASYEIAPGAHALSGGMLFLERTCTLIAADAHLAYEEVIGGALPLWSTPECLSALLLGVGRTNVRELILLGDVIHGSRMSDGAANVVADAIATLRTACDVVLVAGNHEGRSRGATILGQTVESVTRDGWLLVHGDRPVFAGERCIVGHVHPSLHLGGGETVRAFAGGTRAIVLPALTPYSPGLDILSSQGAQALRAFGLVPATTYVVASGDERVYPFGSLAELRETLRAPIGSFSRFQRKVLRPDRA
jgi:metallophosphoesterase superfamily enzyme